MYRGCFEIEGKEKAVLVRLVRDDETLWHMRAQFHDSDRYVAYYEALRDLVKEVIARDISDIQFDGVEVLVANQVQGKWKVRKPKLSRLCVEVRSYLPLITHWGFSLCEGGDSIH